MSDRQNEEEQIVAELLRTRLPARPAPDRLKRAVAEQIARAAAGGTASASTSTAAAARRGEIARRGQRAILTSLGALSLAAAFALGVFVQSSRKGEDGPNPLAREALNNHLRVLYAQNPIEIPNGGLHQVKPWFAGRVDFAPDITFAGDDEYPLLGGAVGYFVDRKAASFVFKRRLHTISLFVFRADGLAWPPGEAFNIGSARVRVTSLEGFHLVFWQSQGLGHALVSDASTEELLRLTSKLVP
jgi:anti-sigma factor RsiW